MKRFNRIVSCAVAAGLMAGAAVKAQSDDAELNVTPYISNQKERRHGFETAEQGSFELYFYQYFEGLGAPVGVFKWYGNYQLSMRVSGDSQGHREFIRFHGENAIGETYKENVTVYPTYYYDYLPARGCVQFEGRGQFNTPLLN